MLWVVRTRWPRQISVANITTCWVKYYICIPITSIACILQKSTHTHTHKKKNNQGNISWELKNGQCRKVFRYSFDVLLGNRDIPKLTICCRLLRSQIGKGTCCQAYRLKDFFCLNNDFRKASANCIGGSTGETLL